MAESRLPWAMRWNTAITALSGCVMERICHSPSKPSASMAVGSAIRARVRVFW